MPRGRKPIPTALRVLRGTPPRTANPDEPKPPALVGVDELPDELTDPGLVLEQRGDA